MTRIDVLGTLHAGQNKISLQRDLSTKVSQKRGDRLMGYGISGVLSSAPRPPSPPACPAVLSGAPVGPSSLLEHKPRAEAELGLPPWRQGQAPLRSQ